ncbi:MAG TPA: RsmD family RNA methyltransferase [Polyangiaceae bacterium]|nr:RsmD family RNA methyltransferase [Polyangiaceae bacterium]
MPPVVPPWPVAVCPVAEVCGGCPLIAQDAARQLELKSRAVSEALAAAGVVMPRLQWMGPGPQLGYRNRVRLRIEPSGTLTFFNPHKEAGCAVLEPNLQELVFRARAFARQHPEHTRGFAHLELRARDDDGRWGACLSPRPSEGAVAEDTVRSLQGIAENLLVAVHGLHVAEAVPQQRRWLASDVYGLLPVDAFVQVNTLMNRELVATLRSLASAHGVQSFLDLYAGSGNFSLPLLREGAHGVAVETHGSATAALARAARLQQLDAIEIETADAPLAAERFAQAGRRWDLVVIDAPRAGARQGLATMARLAGRHMALVSCNPTSLARDLKALVDAGFVIRELRLFDMFAQTRHVEALAWLTRA